MEAIQEMRSLDSALISLGGHLNECGYWDERLDADARAGVVFGRPTPDPVKVRLIAEYRLLAIKVGIVTVTGAHRYDVRLSAFDR